MSKLFFLFSYAGCGSRLLVSLLNSHPDVHCVREPLPARPVHPNPSRVFQELSDRYDKLRVGIDLKYMQTSAAVLHYIDDHSLRVIHLVRDVLETAATRLAAGSSEHNANMEIPRTVEPQRLIAQIRDVAESRRELEMRLAGICVPVLTMHYEDLTAGGEEVSELPDYWRREILSFLGLRDVPMQSEQKKDHRSIRNKIRLTDGTDVESFRMA